MVQALPLAQKDDNHAEVGSFLLSLADMLLNNRGYGESWRLQYLTDLSVLPDYDDGWGYYRADGRRPGRCRRQAGLPSRAQELRDGRDRRPALAVVPGAGGRVRTRSGSTRCGCSSPTSCWNQFGVQTMAHYGWRFGRMATDDTKEDESGTYALHTLGENETIARLATGIKRFKLPDEFNFIKIYQQIAAEPKTGYGVEALGALGPDLREPPAVSQGGRLLAAAAEGVSQRSIPTAARTGSSDSTRSSSNWGRFEPVATQPAGKGATVEYRFRNGTAGRVHRPRDQRREAARRREGVPQVAARSSSTGRRSTSATSATGWSQQNQKQYLGQQVAQWQMDARSRARTISTSASPSPRRCRRPGAYLRHRQDDRRQHELHHPLGRRHGDRQEAARRQDLLLRGRRRHRQAGGQGERRVLRLAADLPRQAAAARSHHQELRRVHRRRRPAHARPAARSRTTTSGSSPPRTAQGPLRLSRLHRRLVRPTATTPSTTPTKVYTITDRPVYRPDQTVKYKFWVRHAKYDMARTRPTSPTSDFTVEIHNPKGEKIVSENEEGRRLRRHRGRVRRFRPTPRWASTA